MQTSYTRWYLRISPMPQPKKSCFSSDRRNVHRGEQYIGGTIHGKEQYMVFVYLISGAGGLERSISRWVPRPKIADVCIFGRNMFWAKSLGACLKNTILDHPPNTAKNGSFEPNGAESEPKGKKPTTLCRSRWFSALNPKS